MMGTNVNIQSTSTISNAAYSDKNYYLSSLVLLYIVIFYSKFGFFLTLVNSKIH